MKTMNEKVTMVTGAAAGIGLVSAEAFAKAGATVVLVDINEPKEQAEKLVSEGYKAVAYRCDVSDTRAVKEMIDWIVATYGRLDAALNNAGILPATHSVSHPFRFTMLRPARQSASAVVLTTFTVCRYPTGASA